MKAAMAIAVGSVVGSEAFVLPSVVSRAAMERHSASREVVRCSASAPESQNRLSFVQKSGAAGVVAVTAAISFGSPLVAAADGKEELKVGEEFTSDSGLKYVVTKIGTGAQPNPGDFVKAHYTGAEARPTPAPSNALAFLRVVGKLKRLKRTGWVHRGVSLPESVSDHMYRMAMCSFLVTDPGLDRSRIMKLAVVHDLAEALAGDIAPFQKISKAEKRRLEEEGLEKICFTIGSDPIASEIKELWLEYEDCSSEEARLVKDLDKMEMIVQADEYEQDQGKDLSEFFDSTDGYCTTPQVQSWDKELREQRCIRLQQAPGTTSNTQK